MIIAACIIAVVLFPTSIVHIAWAYGVLWPAKTEQMLIRTVIGHPDVKRMPNRFLTLMVACCIGFAGLFALIAADIVDLPIPEGIMEGMLVVLIDWFLEGVILFLALVFGVRGVSSYVANGPLGQRIEPFATLDRRYYAPLCFLMCLCFCVIFFGFGG